MRANQSRAILCDTGEPIYVASRRAVFVLYQAIEFGERAITSSPITSAKPMRRIGNRTRTSCTMSRLPFDARSTFSRHRKQHAKAAREFERSDRERNVAKETRSDDGISECLFAGDRRALGSLLQRLQRDRPDGPGYYRKVGSVGGYES